MPKIKLEWVRLTISDYEFILALSFQKAGKVLHDLIAACKHGQKPYYNTNRETIEECRAFIKLRREKMRKWKAIKAKGAKNA